MVKKQIKKSKEMPIGVKILSILSYIGAAVTLLAGLAMILASGLISGLIVNLMPQLADVQYVSGIILFVGFFLLPLAALNYFIARGLRNGKNWARILVLVFSALSVVSSLVPFDLGSLIIGGIIVWYLGFNEKAKAYFQ